MLTSIQHNDDPLEQSFEIAGEPLSPAKDTAALKILTFTQDVAELAPMVELLRSLHYRQRHEGMSIIATPEEWALEANPFIQRYFQEFSVEPPRPDGADRLNWLLAAARRALLEERPERVLVAAGSPLAAPIAQWCRECGIECLDHPTSRESSPRTPMLGRDREGAGQPTDVVRQPLAWEELLGPHLQRLQHLLGPGPYRYAGPAELRPWLEQACPALRLDSREDAPPLALFALACAEDADRSLSELCRHPEAVCLEAVNLAVPGGHRCFRFGDYDNEFALGPADRDLREMLPPGWRPELITRRSGAAGPGPLEAPDALPPLFLLRRDETRGHWLDRFRLPPGERLKIVFADSQNIAGAVLNHACAVNRYTPHEAWSLCTTRHPFIDYPEQDCRIQLLQDATLTPELRRILEQADCFVFFEDDDETSPCWPIDLRPFVRGKRVVHVYIGWRVHRNVPGLQRKDRTVLTPLPHLLRMFSDAHFYAGFPPVTLNDIPLAPPLSQTDGVVRVLHTPSLPHRRLGRYYYHKDTEAFLGAARRLKARLGNGVEFWQVAGWPHAQVLRARQQADITFNQLRGYHGLSGDEAMYLGRPMVGAFDQCNINRHREYWGLEVEFPWVTATRQTLEAVLEELVGDQELRHRCGEAGREFMMEYFSPQVGIVPLLWLCHRATVAE